MAEYDFLKELNVVVEENVLLASYTTFRLGGKCPCMITCETPLQLEGVAKQLWVKGLPFILIGGGSNLIVSDRGVDCIVVRYTSVNSLIELDNNELVVSASTPLDSLVLYAAHNGLGGINFASGIPGVVGGAVVGNAGAFGKQVGDCLKSVIVLESPGVRKEVPAQKLQLSYRDSILKRQGDIVLAARFALQPAEKEKLLQEREEILNLRKNKHPDWHKQPSAGSVFRNLEPTSKAGRRQAAGWFLEQAGAKDLHFGGAVLFEKHANIIVKDQQCTAQDVFNLIEKMKEIVKQKFGMDLEREVRFVGEFEGVVEKSHPVIW